MAAAVMVTDPKSTPVSCGAEEGVVAPAAIRMFGGLIVSLEVSLLVRATTTPPAGAAVDRLNGKATVWPTPTIALGNTICDPGEVFTVSVTFAVWVRPAPLAVIVRG